MMTSLRVTNWLLLGILVALLAHLGWNLDSTPALAGPYTAQEAIAAAITDRPSDKPARYLHVVTHNFAGD